MSQITAPVALGLAVRMASGVTLTDEQAEMAVRSLQTNRWYMEFVDTQREGLNEALEFYGIYSDGDLRMALRQQWLEGHASRDEVPA